MRDLLATVSHRCFEPLEMRLGLGIWLGAGGEGSGLGFYANGFGLLYWWGVI